MNEDKFANPVLQPTSTSSPAHGTLDGTPITTVAAPILTKVAPTPGFIQNYVDIRRYVGDDLFELLGELYFYSAKHNKLFTVPVGFRTDFASIPWFLQSLIRVNNHTIHAAIIHDFGCTLLGQATWGITQKEADKLFLEAMSSIKDIKTGKPIPWFLKRTMYRGVRTYQSIKSRLREWWNAT